jgi:hypothetical protein
VNQRADDRQKFGDCGARVAFANLDDLIDGRVAT